MSKSTKTNRKANKTTKSNKVPTKKIGVRTKVLEMLRKASKASPVSKEDVLAVVLRTLKGLDKDWLKKRVNTVLCASYMRQHGLKLVQHGEDYWMSNKSK